MPPNDMPGPDLPIAKPDTSKPLARRRGRGISLLVLAGCGALVAIGIYVGIRERAQALATLTRATTEAAIATVNVVRPDASAPAQMLALPGNTEAFIDTPIYARTSGYLKTWYFDIGAHVKQGDLLADIDTPEIDEQLRRATADLATADGNMKLAAITADRNEKLLKTRSVSTQERDNAVSAYSVDKTIVEARQAEVARLQQLQAYEKVVAPFDGVVTARRVDTGALVSADTTGPGREMFHMAATDKLRIYMAVPEIYSAAAVPGTTAKVTLDEFPGETFAGTLVRTSNAIDPASRTLNVEVDVDNPSGRLLPGAYAFVRFELPKRENTFIIPANALLFQSAGLQVAIVRDGAAVLVPIKIGRDFGDKVEVVEGLKATDDVILDPSDSLISGTKVTINPAKKAAATQ